eukprot:Trichotokara_eunicae@DN3185_c0_g1_i2.p1
MTKFKEIDIKTHDGEIVELDDSAKGLFVSEVFALNNKPKEIYGKISKKINAKTILLQVKSLLGAVSKKRGLHGSGGYHRVELLDSFCSKNDSQYCLLYISDTKEELSKKDHKIMQEISEIFVDEPVKILYTEGEAAIKISNSFNVSPSTVVLYRAKRARYHVFEKVDKDLIREYTANVLAGWERLDERFKDEL